MWAQKDDNDPTRKPMSYKHIRIGAVFLLMLVSQISYLMPEQSRQSMKITNIIWLVKIIVMTELIWILKLDNLHSPLIANLLIKCKFSLS